MKSTIAFVLLLALLVSCNPPKESETKTTATLSSNEASNLADSLAQYFSVLHQNNDFNGSILITRGEQTIFEQSYGLANRQFKIPNSSETKFLIGSVTKPFTAMAVLTLIESGKLSLKTKLSEFYPDFPKADSVTIEQLLTHSSGVPNYHSDPNWRAASKSDATTPDYTINVMAGFPYRFSPGSAFWYTNTGYILLGRIIEKVSGQSFEDYLEANVLSLLKLHNTGVINNQTIISNLAEGYLSTPLETTKADYINYAQPFTSGNMYSTTSDLIAFTKATENAQLISKELTEKALSKKVGNYGFGWGIRDFNGIKAIGHHGGMNGYIGSITHLIEEDITVCFLTNDDVTPKYSITNNVVKILTGEQIEMPTKIKMNPLTTADSNKVMGQYLVKAGDTLTVYKEDTKLMMKETGQVPLELFHTDSLEFIFAQFETSVKFTDSGDPFATALTFMHNNSSATRVTH